MFKRKLSLFLLGCFCTFAFCQAGPVLCTPGFTAPDTVCVNQPIQIVNQNVCPSASNYWSFCSGNLHDVPTAANIGNPDSLVYAPVFMSLVSDNNIKYGFLVDHVGIGGQKGSIIRYNFGNSYLNTPTGTSLGDFGITNFFQVEELVIKKDGDGNWYGFVVTAGGYFYRLKFGNSLANEPTYENIGYFGSLYGINILQEGNNWYLLTSNPNSSSLLRFSFGTSLANMPSTTYLGNISGALTSPGNITSVFDNGDWYTFVSCRANSTIARVNWGNSLSNTPTANNMGNIGQLNMPRGLRILRDCGEYFGYLTNEGTNTITRLEFPNGINYPPVGTNLGNLGSLDFPHSISDIFRQGDNVYMFIPNVNGNSLTRLRFTNCTNASIPSSTLANPPVFSYNQTGTFNVSLTVNEGGIDQNTFCKPIVVVGPLQKPDAFANTPCIGDTLKLRVNNVDPIAHYSWNGPGGFSAYGANVNIPNVSVSGQYIVTATNPCGAQKDTVNVSLLHLNVNLGRDTSICSGAQIMLNATIPNAIYLWNTGASSRTIPVTSGGTYFVRVTANGCTARDSIKITTVQQPAPFNLGNDTGYCGSFSRILTTSDTSTAWSTGATGASITVNQPGIYIATISNTCGSTSDTIVLSQDNVSVNLGRDTTLCNGAQIILNATTPGATYAWNTGTSSSSIAVTAAGMYAVKVTTPAGCISRDTISISVNQKPAAISLGMDTFYCGNFSRMLFTGDAQTHWSTRTTSAGIIINQGGTYIATATNVCGTESDTIVIRQFSMPEVNLGPDTALCETPVELKPGTATGAVQWSTGENTASIFVKDAGLYWVMVTDNNHCQNSDTILIRNNCVDDIFLPGAFSPNGDYTNDIFMPLSNRKNLMIGQFLIYDRWGTEIYKAENFTVTDTANGWDGRYNGTDSPEGVYVYYVVLPVSENNPRQTKTFKGTVTLLR